MSYNFRLGNGLRRTFKTGIIFNFLKTFYFYDYINRIIFLCIRPHVHIMCFICLNVKNIMSLMLSWFSSVNNEWKIVEWIIVINPINSFSKPPISQRSRILNKYIGVLNTTVLRLEVSLKRDKCHVFGVCFSYNMFSNFSSVKYVHNWPRTRNLCVHIICTSNRRTWKKSRY